MESIQITILFLDKDGFNLYASTLESPMRFNFPKEIFQDMEIMNTDAFTDQIASFLTTYNVPPSTLTILISQSLLFIQDIPTVITLPDESTPPQTISAVEQQKKIQDFLDTVPFEVIESKTYPIEGGIRVVATNKSLYENIVSVFEKQGSIVKTVIPAFILGIPNEDLSDEVITAVINNSDALKADSFMIHPQEIIPLTPEEKKKEFLSLPKQQTKLYAYGGVFVILLAVLGFMYKSMLDQNNGIPNNTVAIQPHTQQAPAVIVTPTTATIPVSSFVASSSAVNKASITIQIQTNSTTATQGQLIKNKLLEKGYTNVLISANAPTTTTKTLLLFSTTVDTPTQQEITNIIGNIFTNFSTQQATQTTYNVTIIPSNQF
ncbi:MAG TPA: hypothetical protein VLG12_06295 [Candidatus Saccharimonadales bacterium]|nr:hypothetical protein [Candidatus Saccharimonadales bacterium]